jgi:hypothetical protein
VYVCDECDPRLGYLSLRYLNIHCLSSSASDVS